MDLILWMMLMKRLTIKKTKQNKKQMEAHLQVNVPTYCTKETMPEYLKRYTTSSPTHPKRKGTGGKK